MLISGLLVSWLLIHRLLVNGLLVNGLLSRLRLRLHRCLLLRLALGGLWLFSRDACAAFRAKSRLAY